MIKDFCLTVYAQVRTALWLMPVPQAHALTVPAAPIGTTTTTVHAHLASRARTAAMTLMSAASRESVWMEASVWTHMVLFAVSVFLATVGARVRCLRSPARHPSASMGEPAIKLGTTLMNALACQVHRNEHAYTLSRPHSHTHEHLYPLGSYGSNVSLLLRKKREERGGGVKWSKAAWHQGGIYFMTLLRSH